MTIRGCRRPRGAGWRRARTRGRLSRRPQRRHQEPRRHRRALGPARGTATAASADIRCCARASRSASSSTARQRRPDSSTSWRVRTRDVAPTPAGGGGRSVPSSPSTPSAGDVTVHFGDVLHAAPPPTVRVRTDAPCTSRSLGRRRWHSSDPATGTTTCSSSTTVRSTRSRSSARERGEGGPSLRPSCPDGCAWDILDLQLGSLGLLTPSASPRPRRSSAPGSASRSTCLSTSRTPRSSGASRSGARCSTLFDNFLDDRLDSFFPQASTQWDGFGHFAHTTLGFFGGLSAAQVKAGELGIEAWAAATTLVSAGSPVEVWTLVARLDGAGLRLLVVLRERGRGNADRTTDDRGRQQIAQIRILPHVGPLVRRPQP